MKSFIFLINILSFSKHQFCHNLNGFISGRIFQLGGKYISHEVGMCVTAEFSVLAKNNLLDDGCYFRAIHFISAQFHELWSPRVL